MPAARTDGPDTLLRARTAAASLSDQALIGELKKGPGAFQPEAWQALEEEGRRRARRAPGRRVVLSTGLSTDLRPIRTTLGIVGSEYVIGVHLLQEFLAGIRDMVGGRSETIQSLLRRGRQEVLDELSGQAAALEADAVIGISFALSEISGQGKSMLVLIGTGTAVRLEDEGEPVPIPPT